jgi:hypothetical protein
MDHEALEMPVRLDPRVGGDRQLVEVARAERLRHLHHDHPRVGDETLRDARGLRQRLEPRHRIGELRVGELPHGPRHEEPEHLGGVADPALVGDDGEPLEKSEGFHSDRRILPRTAGGEALKFRSELIEQSNAPVRPARLVDQRFEDLLVVLL